MLEKYYSHLLIDFRPGTSMPYSAPECFTRNSKLSQNIAPSFNYKSDIYSFCMLMFELLFNNYPFEYNRVLYEKYKSSYTDKDYFKFMLISPEKYLSNGSGLGTAC